MLCFHCEKFFHDEGTCPAKQAQANASSSGEHSNANSKFSETREHDKSMFVPWMVVKKAQRRNFNASQAGDTNKIPAPLAPVDTLINGTNSGSRFAVLVDTENANDSDEIVPDNTTSPLAAAPVQAQSSVQIRDNERAQLKAGLQATMNLANKNSVKKNSKVTAHSSASGSVSAGAPKIATTEPSHKYSSRPHTVSPSPSLATSTLPINQTKPIAPSLDSPSEHLDVVAATPLTDIQPVVNPSQESDELGIGVNGAAREMVICRLIFSLKVRIFHMTILSRTLTLLCRVEIVCPFFTIYYLCR